MTLNLNTPLRAFAFGLSLAIAATSVAAEERSTFTKGIADIKAYEGDDYDGTCLWFKVAKYTSKRDIGYQQLPEYTCRKNKQDFMRGRPAWVAGVATIDVMLEIYKRNKG